MTGHISQAGWTVVLLAALLCGLAANPSGSEAKRVRAGTLVLAPGAGARLPARPVTIRIRAGRLAQVGARLNGRPIGRRLSRPSRRGVRRLVVSPTHGLRHGTNLLRVRVKPRGKRGARLQRLRFRVARGRPLAAAGLDRRIALHASFRPNGRLSRPRPARRGRPLRYRWQLIRAPRGSRFARRARAAARRAAPVRDLGPRPRFRRRAAPRPLLRFDHPGVYRLRLTVVGPEGRRGSDTVSLRADPDPLVEVDTMAKPPGQPYWGVRVGEAFYPDPGKNAEWLQIVLLRAASQELIWNRSYACPAASAHPRVTETAAVASCIARVHADVDKAREGTGGELLAIGVSQRVDGKVQRSGPWQVQPPVGFYKALDQLGTDPDENAVFEHTDTPLLRGRMSRITRVADGFTRTIAVHEVIDLEDLRYPGEVQGFLVRDNLGRYSSFASPERLPYDTQAAGATPLVNVMRVGGRTYKSIKDDAYKPIGKGEGGFQVTMIDPQSLTGDSEMFRTRISCQGNCALETEDLPGWIEGQVKRGRTMLFLASVGNPRIDAGAVEDRGNKEAASAGANAFVSLLVDKFGATANRVYRALTDTGTGPGGVRSYTLVSSFGAAPASGLEREGGLTAKELNAVPASGSLTRSRWGFGYETQGGADASAGGKLRAVALSTPGAWPEQGDKGRAAAIVRLGAQLGIDSRRSLYWTQPFTVSFWDAKLEAIGEASYPAGAGFAQADFAWAKKELQLEIRWLKSAHGYAQELAQPFAKGSLSAWADTGKIAAEINSLVKAPAATQTRDELEIGLFLNLFRHLGEAVPGVGDAVEAVGAVYDFAVEVAEFGESGGGTADEPFRAKVGEVGAQVAKRLSKAQETLEDQLVDIVAADYTKLRTVGTCGALEGACPDKPLSQWEFTQVEQGKAAPAVEDSMKAFVYTALLPAKYDAWRLPVSTHAATDSDGFQVAGQNAEGFWCAFHGLPTSAQVRYPTFRNVMDLRRDNQWQVVAYAHRTGNGTLTKHYSMELPQSAVTDPLFEARGNGGLGVDPEVFFRSAWGVSGSTSFDHFPERISGTQWIEKDKPVGFKNNCGW